MRHLPQDSLSVSAARKRRKAPQVIGVLVAAASAVACGGPSARPPSAVAGDTVADSQSVEPVQLRHRHREGQLYRTVLDVRQGLPTGQTAHTEVISHNLITGETADGSFTMEDRIDSLRVLVDGQTIPLPGGIDAFTQARIRYAIDNRGRPVGTPTVENGDDLDPDILASILDGQGQTSFILPEAPVGPGDRWPFAKELERRTPLGPLTSTITGEAELVGIDRSVDPAMADIHLQATITIPESSAGPLRIRGDGRLAGTYRISVADGMTGQGHYEVTMRIRGEAPDRPEPFVIETETILDFEVGAAPPG